MHDQLKPDTAIKPANQKLEVYLTEAEAADVLKISRRTLQRWRQEGNQGLPFCRFGGLVRYVLSDIEGWAESQRRTSTSEAPHASR